MIPEQSGSSRRFMTARVTQAAKRRYRALAGGGGNGVYQSVAPVQTRQAKATKATDKRLNGFAFSLGRRAEGEPKALYISAAILQDSGPGPASERLRSRASF